MVDRSSPDELASHLKEAFKEWREVILHLHGVLIWQQNYHPFLVAGLLTFAFFLIWILEASFLTTLSLIGIVACLLDYFVPIVSRNFLASFKWTDADEEQFSKVCKELSSAWLSTIEAFHLLNKVKSEWPKMYYLVVLSFLLIMAWVGNIINNLFLTYLIFLFVVLFPGLKNRGIIDQYSKLLHAKLSQYVKKKQ